MNHSHRFITNPKSQNLFKKEKASCFSWLRELRRSIRRVKERKEYKGDLVKQGIDRLIRVEQRINTLNRDISNQQGSEWIGLSIDLKSATKGCN